MPSGNVTYLQPIPPPPDVERLDMGEFISNPVDHNTLRFYEGLQSHWVDGLELEPLTPQGD